MPHPRFFTLLIKPASADCNLRCRYCFYLDKAKLYPHAGTHRMSDAVLEQMIRSFMGTSQPTYSFGWQGGEPTLMGVEFFRKVTRFQERYGWPGASVANGIQTNATLVNDEMAEHFARYNYLVGCSLDGPPKYHNMFRRLAGGQPTHALVMRGIETLLRHNVAVNILVLVSKANVQKAREVYRYLVEHGHLHHQYIPCVEFDAQGRLEPFAITGPEWGSFLCSLFDEWQARDTRRVSVRHFDAAVIKMVDGQDAVCTLCSDCRQYFVVEHNGDIYPCDFFVAPAWKLGNVMDTAWQAALDSPLYASFGARKMERHQQCARCRYVRFCEGDCVKHRGGDGRPVQSLSHLCKGWQRFYEHALPRLERLADDVRRERALTV